jgi:hypothetical protein
LNLFAQAETDKVTQRLSELDKNDTSDVDIYMLGLTSSLDKRSGKTPLSGVRITVQDLYGSDILDTTGADAYYELHLKFDNKYEIYFEHPKYDTKFVEIDTRDVIDIEKARGYILPTDITMEDYQSPAVEKLLRKRPIGKAYYDKSTQILNWDMDYTAKVKDKINSFEGGVEN